MNIFIVGSKPEADFPDIMPDKIIAANGSIARVQRYYEKAEIIGILSSQVLNSKKLHADPTRSILKNTNVDDICIVNSFSIKRDLTLKDIELTCKKTGIISAGFQTKLIISQLGWASLFKRIFKISKGKLFVKNILNLIRIKPVRSLKISTGLLGLAMAIEKFGFHNDFYMIGIGLNPNTGHYYHHEKIYGGGHVAADKFYLSELLRKHPLMNLFPDDKNIIGLIEKSKNIC